MTWAFLLTILRVIAGTAFVLMALFYQFIGERDKATNALAWAILSLLP